MSLKEGTSPILHLTSSLHTNMVDHRGKVSIFLPRSRSRQSLSPFAGVSHLVCHHTACLMSHTHQGARLKVKGSTSVHRPAVKDKDHTSLRVVRPSDHAHLQQARHNSDLLSTNSGRRFLLISHTHLDQVRSFFSNNPLFKASRDFLAPRPLVSRCCVGCDA